MTTYPAITGKALVGALVKAGFVVVSIKGSHNILKYADGRMTIAPVHSGETVGVGLMAKILRDRDLTRDALQELL